MLKKGSWFTLCDSASAYCAVILKHFLSNLVSVVHLTSWQLTFFLFDKMKTALKGKSFQDIEDMKKNITAELNAFPVEFIYSI